MPLLTQNSINKIVELLVEHFSVDRPFYKVPTCFLVYFGARDDYMAKSEYAALSGYSIKPPIQNGKYDSHAQWFSEQLQKELDAHTSHDAVIAKHDHSNTDAWSAAENDPDGRRCLEKANATPIIPKLDEDPFDNPLGAVKAAQDAGIKVAVIGPTEHD